MEIYSMPMGPIKANCYVLIDENTKKAAVMDPGDYTEDLKEFLHSDDISSVEYILLTHGHYDHILGVPRVKADFPDAKICIHHCDAEFLLNDRLSLAHQCGAEQTYINCDITLKEGSIINLGDSQLKVMHTPGHTNGGVCYVYEEERIIFTGDTLFCRTVGRTDLPCGDDHKLIESIKRLKKLDGEYDILPGHNRATVLSWEREHNRCMRKLK